LTVKANKKSGFCAVAVACAFALALPLSHAAGEESKAGLVQTLALGGKTLKIVRGDSDLDCGDCAYGEDEVSIDGRILLEDAIVSPRRTYADAEVDAVVLELNNGGNGGGCITRYAIVWVTKSGAVGTTNPFYDECDEYPDFIVVPGEIIVRFAPNIRRDGSIYRWTSKGGLEAPVVEEFAPDLGKDWDWLGFGFDRWDIFENAGVYGAIKTVLGPNFEPFRTCFDRSSDLKTIGDDLIFGAADGDYTSRQVVFAIAPKQERVFVAMRLEDRRWRFYPAESDWPKNLKSQLAARYPSETGGFK
jgi:hypothetical protein